jgi:hypothetical protein
MAYQQISSPPLVRKGIGLVVRALAVVCAIAGLALADPALAGDDLGTGIGAEALCAASQHPGACEQQISWAHEMFCKSAEGKDRDTCAIKIIVLNLGNITGEYNLLKLRLEGDCFRIGHECPPAAQDTQAIERAVKHCVEVVHRADTGQLNTLGFAQFDAFFNPGTGRVEDSGGNPVGALRIP